MNLFHEEKTETMDGLEQLKNELDTESADEETVEFDSDAEETKLELSNAEESDFKELSQEQMSDSETTNVAMDEAEVVKDETLSAPTEIQQEAHTQTDVKLLRKLGLVDKIKPYRRYLIGFAALIFAVVLVLSFGLRDQSVSGEIEETQSTEVPFSERTMDAVGYTPKRQVPEGDKPETEYMSYQAMQDSLKGWISEFGRINIRNKADFEGEVIDYVVFGNPVIVFEQEGEFTRVKYVSARSGEIVEGYCFSEYISRTEPEGPQIYLNVPLYKQADQRWGAVKIGSYETLASAGCTTTCISMVESYMTGQDVMPDDVVKMLYYTYDGRLVFPDYYVHHWARDYMTVALQKLREGIPVLVSGYNAAGGTHWVVLVAYKGDGENFSPDMFLINDPGSPRSTLADFMRDYPYIEKIVYYNK